MKRRLRRHSKRGDPELDITAFMNLMVILVPFLLISAVFSRIVVLELNLPTEDEMSAGVAGAGKQGAQLELLVYEKEMIIGNGKGGVIKHLPHKNNKPDFQLLSSSLQQVKKRFPKKTDISILSEASVSYDVLIGAMDSVRVADVMVAGSLVQKELFPDIALGDAPKLK